RSDRRNIRSESRRTRIRRKMESSSSTLPSIWNLSFDKFGEQDERFLPAEVTCFGRNRIGHPFLHNAHLSSARNFFQRDRGLYLAGHVRIIELVGVTNALVRFQFEIRSSEGMALPGREIGERHLVTAANFRLQLMHLACESIWRKPFRHCVG